MNIIKNLDGFEGHDLKILKIVDDDLDKKLPGYTSFKQYNMGFIILRGAYNIYKDINTKNRAIYLVLKAKNDKTRWNYATWQMKVNLIYDMRKGISDYVDDYSDEQRGEAVLTVLKSARNKDELDKIIEGLYKPGLGRERIDVTDLMTEEQKISYKALVL